MTCCGSKALWAEVLSVAIIDALTGVVGLSGSADEKVRAIEEARAYLLQPNRDFEIVCGLAGLDPDAVRDRLTTQIAHAPTPEQIVHRSGRPKANRRSVRTQSKRKPRQRKPRAQEQGVVSNCATYAGTSDGTTIQDVSNITSPLNKAA